MKTSSTRFSHPEEKKSPIDNHQNDQAKTLRLVDKGNTVVITGFKGTPRKTRHDSEEKAIIRRLFELGLVIGEKVKVSHKSPFGGQVIAVEILGSLIGLNQREADLILIERP